MRYKTNVGRMADARGLFPSCASNEVWSDHAVNRMAKAMFGNEATQFHFWIYGRLEKDAFVELLKASVAALRKPRKKEDDIFYEIRVPGIRVLNGSSVVWQEDGSPFYCIEIARG